jgi:hypothetical protein
MKSGRRHIQVWADWADQAALPVDAQTLNQRYSRSYQFSSGIGGT